jgi:magnesium transporter
VKQHAMGTFTWVELNEPSPEELDVVCNRFGLPRFAIDIGLRPHHRTRVEHYEGHILLVLKPASYLDPDEIIEIRQLAVLLGDEVVVTIGNGHQEPFGTIARRLRSDAASLGLGPVAVVPAILDQLVDAYAGVLDELDNDVDEIETQVFSPGRGSHAERIYRLKSEVQEFRRAVGPLPDQLDELLAEGRAPGSVALADHLRDLRAKAVRATEHIDHLDGLLNSALSAHQAQIGIQQNNDMRRISAWVAIVATPTAMAGIYGMNFRYMPELEWRYGYFLVLTVMASICVVLYRLFKRSGWL